MNLPNILTLMRIVLIPLFVGAFLINGISDWITLALFGLAAITDALDGYIARKQNIVTDFGKLMDPLADKLMVMSAFICFCAEGYLGAVVTVVIMAREFLVTWVRSFAASKDKIIAADVWGKAKTIAQDVTIIVILVQSATGSPNASFIGIISYLCIHIMAILTVVSAVNYFIKNKDLFINKE